jgi:hypothetical protein
VLAAVGSGADFAGGLRSGTSGGSGGWRSDAGGGGG